MTYEQARKDWEFLWGIDEAFDMTGGYVDQEDLRRLLLNPSKKTAKECFVRQIEYWFSVGPEMKPSFGVSNNLEKYPQTREIAERHNVI